MAKRHMKRCPKSVIITDMQIKTTLRYYLTLVKKGITINQQKTSTGEMWRKENPFALSVRMQPGAATVESSMEIPHEVTDGSTV